jgi:hypothetical protein
MFPHTNHCEMLMLLSRDPSAEPAVAEPAAAELATTARADNIAEVPEIDDLQEGSTAAATDGGGDPAA